LDRGVATSKRRKQGRACNLKSGLKETPDGKELAPIRGGRDRRQVERESSATQAHHKNELTRSGIYGAEEVASSVTKSGINREGFSSSVAQKIAVRKRGFRDEKNISSKCGGEPTHI